MDDDERVLVRLGRIDELSRRDGGGAAAQSGELLAELRGLLHEAEALARVRAPAADGDAGRRWSGAVARRVLGT